MIDLDTDRPSLATGRLRLRFPMAADAPAIAGLAGEAEVARMTTGVPHPYEEEEAETFLRRASRADPREETLFAIDLPGQGAIGLVGLHANVEGATEIGYWLGRPFWGRGYMTEAVRAALDWARTSWGRRWILSGHFTDNAASARVLIKTGFLYTGEIRWRFSLARGEAAPTRMMVWLA
jgi:RimJ/RimL family protein N-acetyltransferase